MIIDMSNSNNVDWKQSPPVMNFIYMVYTTFLGHNWGDPIQSQDSILLQNIYHAYDAS